MWATVRMVLALGAIAVTAWAVLRWNRRSKSSRRHMEILDRSFLARGTSIALVRVDGRRLLLGVSSEGVRLLRDMDSVHGRPGARFGRILEDASAREETGS
jgi:flagellar biosynthetic protein FliO